MKAEEGSQKDRYFENAVKYLGDGEPRRYALALCEKLENTPYSITSYFTSGQVTLRVWAIYLREKGRPKYNRDCIFVTGYFRTPAKTKKSGA